MAMEDRDEQIVARALHMSKTYTDVGDEGIEAGEREPRRWVRRSCELRFESLRSRDGLAARLVADVMCRSSAGESVPFMAGASVRGGEERVVVVRNVED